MNGNEFSVHVFFPDGVHGAEVEFVDAETAVRTALRLSQSVGARLNMIERIIITDGGDHTVFEWKPGEGVTYPNRPVGGRGMNAPARQNQLAEVRAQLDRQLSQFSAVLPKHIPAERFARVILTGIQQNPELLDCDRRSLFSAAMRAAQDGLMPDGRMGAIVVYRGKGTAQAQWLPMIAGLRQKVRNSGEIVDWNAHVVHANDQWDYEEGDNPHILHRPSRGDRGPVVAAYSVARYRTGEVSREWMWFEELEKVRATSKAQRGPWADWTDEMYRKTVAKRHSKVLPMSSDLDDLLRRPDEPDSGPDQSGGVTLPAVLPGQAAPPAALTEALDALSTRKDGPRGHDPFHYKPSVGDEIDGDTGEVIDPGEYADSDAEERPDEAAASRKAVGGV